jgi:uncharacterized protein
MIRILLTVLVATLVAQLLKVVIFYYKEKKYYWKNLVVTGGMPSSHVAMVISLATIIYLYEGLSTLFVVSLTLALIIIRDAVGIRRAVGEDGILINKIAKKLKIKQELHLVLGHKPLEVFMGALIGFIIAIIFYFL